MTLLRGTVTLSAAGGVAGLISLAFTPAYAWIYGPELLGMGALFVAVATCLIPLATLRLEYALVDERDPGNVASLICLCLLGSVSLAILISAVVWTAEAWIPHSIPGGVGFLLPVFVLTQAVWVSCNFVFTREERFQVFGALQVGQAALRGLLVLSLGLLSVSTGMVWGYVLASIATAGFAFLLVVRNLDPEAWRGLSRAKLGSMLAKYQRLMAHSFTTNFANAIAANLMPIAFSLHFSLEAAGYVFLLQQLIGMPARMLVAAFWRSVFSKLSRVEGDQARAKMVRAIYRVFGPLLLIPLALLLGGRTWLSSVLGDDWAMVSEILGPFAVMMYFNMLSNVTSYFVSFDRLRSESVWNMLILGVRIGSILVLPLLSDSMAHCISIYFLLSAIMYFALSAYWAVQLQFKRDFLLQSGLLAVPVILLATLLPGLASPLGQVAVVTLIIGGLSATILRGNTFSMLRNSDQFK